MFEKYLITGATGFLGRTVLTQLRDTQAEIRALVMEGDPLARELPQNVRVIAGDVCDEAALGRFFAGTDEHTCVIHCAGMISVATHPGDRIYRVNVDGTKNVLKRCREHGIGKLVYVSSVHAIPEKPKGMEIAETTVFSAELVKGDYAKSKAMATALVLQAAKEGLNASVVFPSGIIGPGDLGKGSITNMLLSFLAGKLPLAVKGGYDFVDVRDVASGVVACAERGLPGHGYILSGQYAAIRDILELVKKTVNLRRSVSYLPISFAKLVAPLYEKISLRRREPLYFTPYSIMVLDSNGAFSRNAAATALGYTPRPLSSTIRDTVLWLKEKMGGNART